MKDISMLLVNGYLRDSVSINWMSSSVELKFSVWSIEIPLGIFDFSPKLSAFFRREIPSSDLVDEREQVRNLISVLAYQGCLIPEYVKQKYQLNEVKSIYTSFCNESYGRYYAHSLWSIMRNSNIPKAIIRQWISRTYFLSRFAGVTASSASRYSPTLKVRTTFLKSAIEEYSHCNDYYSPPESLFPVTSGSAVRISPSASFVAFDHQMLHIAKNDWLAHLFVALFQERTARFRDGANQLYLRVEAQLNMPGLFDGWRTHISFDEDNSHEGDLDDLFDQNLEIPFDKLQKSFNEATLTIGLLLDGLDDILRLGEKGINPRIVATSKNLSAENLRGIECLWELDEYLIKANSPTVLAAEFAELVANGPRGSVFAANAAKFLFALIERFLVNKSLECIEYCDTHTEIIYIGKVLDIAAKVGMQQAEETSPAEKAERVVENYLSRQTKSPIKFAFCLLVCLRLIEAGIRLSNSSATLAGYSHVIKALEVAAYELGKHESIATYINEAIDVIALLEYAYEQRTAKYPSFKVALA